MTTRIILVRHGETEWNRVERFRGQFDIELNSTGIQQAGQTARRIHESWHPDAVFCSPLRRAYQTAEIIGQPFDLIPTPLPELTDINYGKWQGLSPAEVKLQWPDDLDAWYRDPERAKIQDGENLKAVQERAYSILGILVEKYLDSELVVVSHTVVNRLLLMRILGAPLSHFWRMDQHPCAINLIDHNGSGYFLRSLNDICHL